MPNINLNSETLIGVTLLAVGAFTFAKGVAQQFTRDDYVKSIHQISNLSSTFNEHNNVLGDVVNKK